MHARQHKVTDGNTSKMCNNSIKKSTIYNPNKVTHYEYPWIDPERSRVGVVVTIFQGLQVNQQETKIVNNLGILRDSTRNT